MGDRWISSPFIYTIQPLIQVLDKNQKVNSLIDEATNWWKTPLIFEVFSAEDAALIYNIPICPEWQQDNMVWFRTKYSKFTVKSVSHMAKAKIEGNKGSSSNPDLSKFWKKVWNVKDPQWLECFCGRFALISFPQNSISKKGVS